MKPFLRTVVALSAISVLTFATVAAQLRPDFSGRWEVDAERSERLRHDGVKA